MRNKTSEYVVSASSKSSLNASASASERETDHGYSSRGYGKALPPACIL